MPLGPLPGKPEPELAQRCHVRAMGSYLSGRPDSSDIDILVSPSPAALEAAVASGSPEMAAQLEPQQLLMSLLEALHKQGLIDNHVGFHTASSSSEDSK